MVSGHFIFGLESMVYPNIQASLRQHGFILNI